MKCILLSEAQWQRLKAAAGYAGECMFGVSMAQPAIAEFGSPEHDMQIVIGQTENAMRELSALLAEIEASDGE